MPPYEDWEIGFSSRSDDQLFDRRAGYWISIGSPVSSFHAFFWLGEQGLDLGHVLLLRRGPLVPNVRGSCRLASLLNAPPIEVRVASTISLEGPRQPPLLAG